MSSSTASDVVEKCEPHSAHSSGDHILVIDHPATAAVGEGPNCPVSPAMAQREITETITIPLQKYPRGYPLQAAFQASESGWSIYRSFNYLHSRVILDLQDELRCLEENLEEIDQENSQKQRVGSRKDDILHWRREKEESPRASIIETIRCKLVSYDEIVSKARDLNTFQRPSNRDYRSFRTWMWNRKPLSYEREEEFIKRREDLVSLRQGREWSGFDGLVESCLQKIHCRFTHRLFATKELRDKTNDEHVHYYSQSRVEKLVGLIVTVIIFILLVIPVVTMYKLTVIGHRNSTLDAVGILIVFTMLFSAAMSFLTNAKRHELFAAGATYCAVLVVFITNFNNSSNNANGVLLNH